MANETGPAGFRQAQIDAGASRRAQPRRGPVGVGFGRPSGSFADAAAQWGNDADGPNGRRLSVDQKQKAARALQDITSGMYQGQGLIRKYQELLDTLFGARARFLIRDLDAQTGQGTGIMAGVIAELQEAIK